MNPEKDKFTEQVWGINGSNANVFTKDIERIIKPDVLAGHPRLLAQSIGNLGAFIDSAERVLCSAADSARSDMGELFNEVLRNPSAPLFREVSGAVAKLNFSGEPLDDISKLERELRRHPTLSLIMLAYLHEVERPVFNFARCAVSCLGIDPNQFAYFQSVRQPLSLTQEFLELIAEEAERRTFNTERVADIVRRTDGILREALLFSELKSVCATSNSFIPSSTLTMSSHQATA